MSAHSMEIPISRSHPKTRVDLLLFTFLITFLPKLTPAFEGRLHVLSGEKVCKDHAGFSYIDFFVMH